MKRSLHVVENTTYDATADEKFYKIRPMIKVIVNNCVKIESEKYQSVDEKIIPSKTRQTKIQQYNPKKPKKWGFKNLVRAIASGFMYDFYLYAGKDELNPDSGLQKYAQVVSRFCKDLPPSVGHKVFFNNWLTTLGLMHHLNKEGLLAVVTIRANRLHNCPLTANKDLEKQGRGSMDYRTDNNSGVIITKRLDNSTMELTSNFIGIEPLGEIERWCKQGKAPKL